MCAVIATIVATIVPIVSCPTLQKLRLQKNSDSTIFQALVALLFASFYPFTQAAKKLYQMSSMPLYSFLFIQNANHCFHFLN